MESVDSINTFAEPDAILVTLSVVTEYTSPIYSIISTFCISPVLQFSNSVLLDESESVDTT